MSINMGLVVELRTIAIALAIIHEVSRLAFQALVVGALTTMSHQGRAKPTFS